MNKSIRLLVVDDDDVIRENMVAYLEDEGFDVTHANSAEDALKIIADNVFDIGIIDMRLPGIDGSEFILKAYAICPDMKCIIHTGSTNYILNRSLIDIGIKPSHILLKPVSDMGLIVDLIMKRYSGE